MFLNSRKIIVALGRKNYLFAESHDGARRAATFYALFATCKLNDVNPHRWLRDLLMRIQEHPENRLNEPLPLESYQYLMMRRGCSSPDAYL
jgi:hypothetical protein